MKNYFSQMFSSLRIRNYRLYFTGQAISLCGTWMQTIAQDWLVLKLTNSGTQLGIVSALQFLPVLFLGPWGGVIADRFPKRNILLVTNIVAGLLALILGLLVVAGTVQVWMIYILALGLGLVSVVDNPTRQSFLIEMVGRESLTNAIALNSTEVNFARAVGPALAGVAIVVVGIAPCFFINAISYIAVIFTLYLIDLTKLNIAQNLNRAKVRMIDGLRYAWSNIAIRNVLIMMAIIGTLTFEFSTSLPLIARFTFKGNAGSYAALSAAMGLGSLVGALYVARKKRSPVPLFLLSSFSFGVTLIIASVMPNLWSIMVVFFFVGASSMGFYSLGNTIIQLESRPEMRGRVMSLWFTAFLGSTPIGGPVIGWVGENFGPRWTLAIGGLAAVLAVVLCAKALIGHARAKAITEAAKIGEERSVVEGGTKLA